MTTQFAKYLEEGDRAVKLHPDFDQLDYETAATDMIASILHAVFDGPGARNGSDSPEDMLARARRCYDGDQEDRTPDEEERVYWPVTEADRVRAAYVADPTVTGEEYGRMVEEADERDRARAAEAEVAAEDRTPAPGEYGYEEPALHEDETPADPNKGRWVAVTYTGDGPYVEGPFATEAEAKKSVFDYYIAEGYAETPGEAAAKYAEDGDVWVSALRLDEGR